MARVCLVNSGAATLCYIFDTTRQASFVKQSYVRRVINCDTHKNLTKKRVPDKSGCRNYQLEVPNLLGRMIYLYNILLFLSGLGWIGKRGNKDFSV